jgi:hypothetical protein
MKKSDWVKKQVRVGCSGMYLKSQLLRKDAYSPGASPEKNVKH